MAASSSFFRRIIRSRNYVIFARVTGGLEVVDALANTPTTTGPGGEVSRPVAPLTMKKVTIRP